MEVKARLAGMDPAMEEAARDLGAGPFRAFWDITLPLIMPAVISGSLLAFAMSMDDVVISIFVNGPRLSTLPIKVYTQLKKNYNYFSTGSYCSLLSSATSLLFELFSSTIFARTPLTNAGEESSPYFFAMFTTSFIIILKGVCI